ncbi:MAG: hypothetical protein FD141_1550 [Fusobacteria bacterium]|nr:MAG: hypothetical protein FD141_1550 [Fusobacteriota bacterium]KAF0230263.1 MAG: hypothetical protein FD182_653 [Fusobacteriota bacterium]
MDELILITKGKIDKESLLEDQIKKWQNWKWQTKNSIKTVQQVEQILGISFSENEKKKLNIR